MKKIICLIIATLLFSLVTVSAGSNPVLADNAELFTDMEKQSLVNKLEEIYDEHDFSVILITDHYYSYPQDTLEEYLEENPYMDSDFEGVVFGQDVELREYFTIGFGYGQTVITDEALDAIDDTIVPYFKNDEYYEGYYEYLNLIEIFVEAADSGVTYSGPPSSFDDWIPAILIGLIVGIVVAFVVTGVMKSAMNTARKKEEASSYLKEETFNLTQSYDNFLYDTVTRTAKPKNNSSSSSGGGGGGGSRGGRGGGSY